ncbi:Predicted amino acid racemase [Alkalithermobacter thermoalcaliphilus JW-YL-7 = DSM 7308]|uniref:Alanine racemase domain protein n=1 Tax=Alkalithermobacter thermoalcaliphilus JW-YL-7 = DSM 7308 TaxID=1121328 RepID=A0A150FQS2_CLOPD|nr:alanine racemase domain protein [[Clostridium] paradoxum JW-YL-7 = DSM 7308]SHK75809.1 Predicted amino acid racemase [[Clostridium] paradoxum JW-YL-7 = DSM 7308]
MYPLLEINLGKIYQNARYIVKFCESKNIDVAFVVKGFNAIPEVVNLISQSGCKYIADSRIEHIKKLVKNNINSKFMLLRIPMLSEIKDLVKYVNISLNSEIKTLIEIEKECLIQNKEHNVILMYDVGDLREGIFEDEELIQTALYIEKNLKKVKLYGIGTNVGCYGGVVPTKENIGKLEKVAIQIEEKIGRKLNIISGGATTSLTLLIKDEMPKKINNLRIGEGMILGRDLKDLWGYDIKEIHKDAFILKAQVVEVKQKPSKPIGKLFVDAFGKIPEFKDYGIRKRALLAIGKADFVFCDQLIPRLQGIKILGGSSDHLILDINDCKEDIQVGDILEFEICYGPMLYLTNSSCVRKVFV